MPEAVNKKVGGNSKKRFGKRNSGPSFELFLGSLSSNSRFAESYRTLRTNIDFATMDKDFRTLLITSAAAMEGKTLTTANLAYTINKKGKSVLMIDADLRKPMLSRFVESNESHGLTGLLTEAFNAKITNGPINEKFGISDLLRLLSFQKKTGRLNLSDSTENLEFFFLQGDLVDLNWLNRPEEKKLAAILIANGQITREQAQKSNHIDKKEPARNLALFSSIWVY